MIENEEVWLDVSAEFLKQNHPPPRVSPLTGANMRVSEAEAAAVRYRFVEVQNVELVAAEYNLTVEETELVLEGEIWTFTGGPLRPPKTSGLHLDNCGSSAEVMFVKGVYRLASKLLPPDRFDILCVLNGYETIKGIELAEEAEVFEYEFSEERVCDILRLHEAGQDYAWLYIPRLDREESARRRRLRMARHAD